MKDDIEFKMPIFHEFGDAQYCFSDGKIVGTNERPNRYPPHKQAHLQTTIPGKPLESLSACITQFLAERPLLAVHPSGEQIVLPFRKLHYHQTRDWVISKMENGFQIFSILGGVK